MSDHVHAVFNYRVTPGKEELFQSYLDKVLPVTETEEPYVLGYELFRGEDGSYFQHEFYENEDAIWKHMEKTAEGQRDWAEATEIISTLMLGPLSQRFRDTFTGGEGTQWTPFRSIER